MSQLSIHESHINRILKVLIYIEEHLDDSLDLEAMSKIARISPYYFHRLFRVHLNETLMDYVRRLRLQRAAERLNYSKSTITEIALDVGYETPSSFSKIFNQVMGQSPSHYRKTMQSVLEAIMEQVKLKKKDIVMLKPQYIDRKEEEILFVRRTGDYNETPDIAFPILKQFLFDEGVELSDIKTFYGIILDDQHVVMRSKCRFDACVSLSKKVTGKGEIGNKTLPGGYFAVFTHYGAGTPQEIEETLDNIFLAWYPSLRGNSLGDSVPFLEFVNCLDKSIPDYERQTKIFIPLKKSKI